MGAAAVVLVGTGAVVVGSAGAPPAGVDPASQALSSAASAADGGVVGAGGGLTDRGGDLARVSRGGARPDLPNGAELQIRAQLQAHQRTAALRELASATEDRTEELAAAARDRAAERRAARQWMLPLDDYTLSASFGETSSLWSTVHTGQDFAAAEGTPVVAVSSGVVVSTAYDGSYGNKTVLRLDDGTELWYCHQSGFATSDGEQVDPGEVIGYVGSTGNSTGPHLHLEVRPEGGDPVDPLAALARHGRRA